MKIKTKKQMHLPQLIEHIEQTDYEACVYQADDVPVYVRVGRIKGIHIEGSGTVFPHNTFTVETLEEITENTKFKYLVEISTKGSSIMWEHSYINQRIGGQSKEFHAYIDGEFKLIWTREKGLVE